MISERRVRMGIVKSWYNCDGGYGFILPEEGGEVVFVHHMCIAPQAKAKSLKTGERVSYELTREKMAGLWAKNVCVLD
jgi:CspA family cold shock protein